MNSGGRSCTDSRYSNLEKTAVNGYSAPTYPVQGARFSQVLSRARDMHMPI